MPCTPQSCPSVSTPQIEANFGSRRGAYQHLAHMGWVGFVKLNFKSPVGGTGGLSGDVMLRVSSADLKLSQEINNADVLDGRIDRTAYWLGPKIVEGSLSFPIIADNGLQGAGASCPDPNDLDQAGKLLNAVWAWGTTRDRFGRMCYSNTDMMIRYANHAAFTYHRCLINTLSFKVAQGDLATFDLGVYGTSRTTLVTNEGGYNPDEAKIDDFLSPARCLSWNDFTIYGEEGCTGSFTYLFNSNQVREFNMEVNNNADRFFTLNGTLFPADINVKKREITGSMTLLGYNNNLRVRAETNQERFTSKDKIHVAAYIGKDTHLDDGIGGHRELRETELGAIWQPSLTGVVFQIEEVSLTLDALETTVNYIAHGTDDNYYEAIDPPTSCGFPAWE